MPDNLDIQGNAFAQRMMTKMPNPNPPKVPTLTERIKAEVERERDELPKRKQQKLLLLRNQAAGAARRILQVPSSSEDWIQLSEDAVGLLKEGFLFIYDEKLGSSQFLVAYAEDKRIKLIKEDGQLNEKAKILGQVSNFRELCEKVADQGVL